MAKPTTRLSFVAGAFFIGLLAIIGRAAQVQLLEGDEHRASAEAQRTRGRILEAPRGAIYDRHGVALAITHEVYDVGIARDQLRKPETDLPEIAKALGLRPRDIERRFRRGRWAHIPGPFTAAELEPIRRIKGVHRLAESVRFYPNPDLARSIIGRPAADGRRASGLESVFDSVLTGKPGYTVRLRDRFGVEYDSPSRLDAFPVPGHDLYLTIDADLQEISQQALDEAIERFDAAGGDVVIIRPSTGEILALASRGPGLRGTATALTSVFEPGSTAKIFAAAALLQHELATPDDSIWAEQGTYQLGKRVIRDEHAEGWLTLQQVVERSSNIGIVKATRELAPERQYEMLRDFGLGSPTGVEFPSEAAGILRPPSAWSGTTPASLAIGYEVAVTPLQLAAAYAAIANEGVLLRPTLVSSIRTPAGKTTYQHRPEPVRRAVSRDVAAQLREMLRGVVYRGGTGDPVALVSSEVAGKTGTARRAGPAGYIPGSYTATFASIFPADAPQIVMVVKLDDPRGAYARLTAAPVTRAVLERVLATESGTIDRGVLAMSHADGEPDPAIGAGTVPYVTPWPVEFEIHEPERRRVPDVRGLPVRDAVRRLHGEGLRTTLEGWGRVTATRPGAGARVRTGTLITLVGVEDRPSP